MSMQAILPLLLLGAFAAYAFWAMNKRKKAMENLGPAFRRFFENTGYRYVELGDAPLEAHVEHTEKKWRQMMGPQRTFEQRLVRDFHGAKIFWDSFMGPEGSSYVMSCSWSLKLPNPPRVPWQAADKSLSSMGKAVKEAFSNSTRSWKARYPTAVQAGDPELDKKILFFGEDAQAVQQVLQTAGLKELLLSCTEVDLVVGADEVRFADPMQKNIRAAMGGTIGMMASGTDYGKFMDLSVAVHEKLTELLVVAARASA